MRINENVVYFPEENEARRSWESGKTAEERIAAFKLLRTYLPSRETSWLVGKALGKYGMPTSDALLIEEVLLALGEDTIDYAYRNLASGPVLLGELEGLVRFVEANPARGWAQVLPILQRHQRFSLFGERHRFRQAIERVVKVLDPASNLPIPAEPASTIENLPIPAHSQKVDSDG